MSIIESGEEIYREKKEYSMSEGLSFVISMLDNLFKNRDEVIIAVRGPLNREISVNVENFSKRLKRYCERSSVKITNYKLEPADDLDFLGPDGGKLNDAASKQVFIIDESKADRTILKNSYLIKQKKPDIRLFLYNSGIQFSELAVEEDEMIIMDEGLADRLYHTGNVESPFDPDPEKNRQINRKKNQERLSFFVDLHLELSGLEDYLGLIPIGSSVKGYAVNEEDWFSGTPSDVEFIILYDSSKSSFDNKRSNLEQYLKLIENFIENNDYFFLSDSKQKNKFMSMFDYMSKEGIWFIDLNSKKFKTRITDLEQKKQEIDSEESSNSRDAIIRTIAVLPMMIMKKKGIKIKKYKNEIKSLLKLISEEKRNFLLTKAIFEFSKTFSLPYKTEKRLDIKRSTLEKIIKKRMILAEDRFKNFYCEFY